MKDFSAGLLLGLAILTVTLAVQYSRHDAEVTRLKHENVAAKQWAQEERSRRVAARAAFDAERAGLLARTVSRSVHAAATGSAAARLVDSLYVIAPPDCAPALREIKDAFALHLKADTAAYYTARQLRIADSLALREERLSADELRAKLAEANARTDRAIVEASRGHGWKTDALLVVAAAAAGRLLGR